MSVRVIDHGLDKIIRETHELASLEVASGILEKNASKTYPNGMTLGEVAAFQIYGTRDIPKRDFIGGTADDYRQKTGEVMQQKAEEFMAGASPHAVAKELGEWFQGRIQAHILNGPWAKNAPSTIKRKGHGQVLVDSRLMYNSLDNEVRRRK